MCTDKGMYDAHGKLLCNFKPCVKSICEIYLSDGSKSTLLVDIQIDFENGQSSKPFSVSQSELRSIDWEETDYRCRFQPGISRKTAKDYLADHIRQQLPNAPKHRIYQLDRTGVHKIEGEYVFCVGRNVIWPSISQPNRPEIMLGGIDRNLDVDPNLSEREAASEMLNLLSLSPRPAQVIMAQIILYFLYQAYADAGKEPHVCVFLYGRSGTQKTTLASFLTQLYDRSHGIHSPQRLVATPAAAAQLMSDICNEIVIFDDLCPADSSNIRRQQEETLIEIARYIGDGTIPARIRGNKVLERTPGCGVLFTGEYLIGKGSDAARLLPVKMEQPDGRKLKFYQDHPLMLSTFYYYFISWFISNYDEIVSVLRDGLDYYRTINLGVHSRLQETYFFLDTAYQVLLQYCCERDVFDKNEYTQLTCSFQRLLLDLVKQQNQRVGMGMCNQSGKVNYRDRVASLYEKGQFKIAENKDVFDVQGHDGLYHGEGLLYMRRERLSMYFPDEDIDDVVKELEKSGVLVKGIISRTKQISGLRGMRFYVLKLNQLLI